MRVQHGVEGASVCGVAVKHVEVSVEFLFDKSSQSILVLCFQVLKGVLNNAMLSKESNSFPEAHLESRGLAFEWLEVILFSDNIKFLRVPRLKALEDVDEQVAQHIENLEVMVLDHHFHIQSCEFAQVSISVGVLGSEYWAYLEASLHVSAENHLLVQLRALGKAC